MAEPQNRWHLAQRLHSEHKLCCDLQLADLNNMSAASNWYGKLNAKADRLGVHPHGCQPAWEWRSERRCVELMDAEALHWNRV